MRESVSNCRVIIYRSYCLSFFVHVSIVNALKNIDSLYEKHPPCSLELNLPVIDSFEKSLTSMMQPGSPPPQIVTPFSSSFVKGNELINSKGEAS